MLTRAPRLSAFVQLTAVRLLLLFLTSSIPTAINCTKPSSVFLVESAHSLHGEPSFISVNGVGVTVVIAGKTGSGKKEQHIISLKQLKF